jgi:hypothetical protein
MFIIGMLSIMKSNQKLQSTEFTDIDDYYTNKKVEKKWWKSGEYHRKEIMYRTLQTQLDKLEDQLTNMEAQMILG